MIASTPGTKVFIAGAPRSGTSILVFALKEVFGLPGFGESHVMPAFQRMVHQLRAYTNGFESIPDGVMLKKLNSSDLEHYLFLYIRQFYGEHFPEGSWVDKTPSDEALFGLPLIESVFPDARLIATKRNGIEVVTSHVKKFNSNFNEACLSWVNVMKGLVHARQGCRHLLEVDQYEFLNAAEEVSRRIAIHLNAVDRAEQLANYFATHRVEQSSVLDTKARVHLADTNWSNDEKELFKRHCGKTMEAFGYEV